jgi:hypothetical protein
VVVVSVGHGALLLVEDRCPPDQHHDEHGKSQRSHFTPAGAVSRRPIFRQAVLGWREDVRVR